MRFFLRIKYVEKNKNYTQCEVLFACLLAEQ